MGSIRCDKTNCEYNKTLSCGSYTFEGKHICKRGSGYDYGGGDIQINKFGHCISSKRRKVIPPAEALKED